MTNDSLFKAVRKAVDSFDVETLKLMVLAGIYQGSGFKRHETDMTDDEVAKATKGFKTLASCLRTGLAETN